MKYFKVAALLLLAIFNLQTLSAQKSLYDLRFNLLKGGVMNMNDMRGKVVVVVNIASGGERKKQLLQLDTLCRTIADSSLVILAFPTNDFNTELKSDLELTRSIPSLHPAIKVSRKTQARGLLKSSIFQWCTSKSENGVIDVEVKGDFQKFIVNKEGKIVGVFSGILSPLEKVFKETVSSTLKS